MSELEEIRERIINVIDVNIIFCQHDSELAKIRIKEDLLTIIEKL